MYAKVFRQIYDSTLAEDWRALVTFQQFLVLADSNGLVDMTPGAIQRITNIPLDIIAAGIERLRQPDKASRSSTEDGRRIVPIDPDRDWGWQVVNYSYYRNLSSLDDKREKDRARIAEKRRKKLNVAECRNVSQKVANVAYTDTEADTTKHLAIASHLFALVRNLNPHHREPKFQTWANEIRLMIERDRRTLDEIRSLFEWANAHPFWKTNILSPATLRKQWDKLQTQRIAGAKQPGRAGARKTFDDYLAEEKQDQEVGHDANAIDSTATRVE